MEMSGRSGYDMRRVNAKAEPAEVLSRVLPELRRGGVVLLPADTVYGLSCRWDAARARDRIQALKGPGRLALYVALVANREMALRYAHAPEGRSQSFLEEQWPGPTTVVLRARRDVVPDFCLGPDETVAFRWPRNAFLEDLVMDLGIPVVSTSANRTGEAAVSTAEEAWDVFGAGIDLYVDAGPLLGPPSTLVDLTAPVPRLLRLGPALPHGFDWEIDSIAEDEGDAAEDDDEEDEDDEEDGGDETPGPGDRRDGGRR